MNKTTKWYARPLYAVMALALVAGLMMVPAVVPGTSPIVEATVEDVTVTNDPTTVDTAANYTINFSTRTVLNYHDSDYINITFPNNTHVPNGTKNYNSTVTVNGYSCDNGSVSANNTTRVVNITVPRDISAGSVSVVIAAAAGVRNPTTVATNWTLNVSTSKEITPVPSANYNTTAPVAPEITEVAGKTYQNCNDAVSVTFSKAVQPVGGAAWNASSNFSSIYCGITPLTLTNAVCTIDSANTSLTITLNETADGDYLVIGQTLNVTPAFENITDMTGTTYVANTTVSGNITGEDVAPTVALTYNRTFPVKENDILNITATFSEAMQATPTPPTIAIDTTGNDLSAKDMTEISSTVWNYTYNVTADSSGTATVTITGKDLAGNNVTEAATNNTFTIDNIIPTIGVADIVGTTIQGAGDTINITFSEAVNATDGTWNASDEFDFIQSPNGTNLTLTNAGFAYANETLTITLNEATDEMYLVNNNTVTVKPKANSINDTAGNPVENTTVIGTTAITGDTVVPTITKIVGVGATTINITFSEAVVLAAGGTWDKTVVTLIESPDGAPLNINHATFTPNNDPLANATTVLTVGLNATIDGASWVAGNDICVTPATNKTVDLAGNALGTSKVCRSEVGVALYDGSMKYVGSYDTIQAAINAASANYTINVAAGTYSEAVTINKTGLTLKGANCGIDAVAGTRVTESVINGTALSGTNPQPVHITAANVILDGFTIVGPNEPNSYAVLLGIAGAVPGGEVRNNIIYTKGNFGILTQASSHESWVISNNTVAANSTDSTAVYLAGGEGAQIKGNLITTGGIVLTLAVANTTIQDNTISNTNTGGSGVSIAVSANGVNITGNTFSNNTNGVKIWPSSGASAASNTTINNNNFANNTGYGVLNNITTSVNATLNWWGSVDGPSHSPGSGDKVSANVTYSPWLDAAYPGGSPITEGQVISLKTGWNLVSPMLYIPTANRTPATFLASVVGNVDIVWGYDAATGNFSSYVPSAPPDLTEIRDGKGYWINMTAADTLDVSALGTELPAPPLTPPSYNVYTGWNMIGFKSLTGKNATAYLGPAVSNTMEAMYGYNATADAYTTIQAATDLVPGDGYWLAVNANGTIYP